MYLDVFHKVTGENTGLKGQYHNAHGPSYVYWMQKRSTN